ncbi:MULTISPECIES: alpha/beta fold hydrolase [Enterobacteriaceae]|uniref:Alpha/beta hydrolase n=2 Tax=Salmonella enterica TaxID=28901 RepID=A0A722XQK2_SALER|nr:MULTISPECIES: alpha/beta hydrolase [Enterobacteriaceae]EBX1373605.1 alpha/beta hydrolase [Salmonella enterica subsp. enterica serovar Newport]EDT6403841.1 alpha/beta hydrolase [Salmonella enterica subsp. enterica]EIL0013609.1 alpha/beta hydrolase [Salmonella enterica]HBN1189630.1 alpha/beta hydrolase [Salmonella enterica subsp. enterica serovar Schwarzengrund]EDW1263775.1 alpha/beta hydrolase [Salmonella enterica subsp. enterica]
MRIMTEGINWYYTLTGQGEPVLFLHGGLDTCVNYTRLLTELKDRFSVIAVDRRGHGRTADTDAPFDCALMARELAAFLREMKLPPVHIIGCSDGANIGLHMAAGFPEQVKSLIAVSGNYKGRSGMSDGCLAMFDALSVEFVQETMPDILRQYGELNPAPVPETYIAKTKRMWNQESVISQECLAGISVPVLIVGGDRDMVLPEQLLEMKTLIPDASLLILPYCGHYIFQDFAWSSTAASTVQLFKEFMTTRFSGHNTIFI